MVAGGTANGARTMGIEILSARPKSDYNIHERRFSIVVRRRLDELLQGDRNELMLLRLYAGEDQRIGVMGTPPSIDRTALRLPVARRLLEEALLFLDAGSTGGPTDQVVERDGRVIECQDFPTKYPHIIIQREDIYDGDGALCQTTWQARRVQNQRAQTQINRVFDLANLGLEVMGSLLR